MLCFRLTRLITVGGCCGGFCFLGSCDGLVKLIKVGFGDSW